jgi:hypothetical protein
MIAPKIPKPTAAEERRAYKAATVRDRDTCMRCLRNCGPIARDHRKNRSQGGRTVLSNLQLLGLGCHQWKTEYPDLAIEDGWGVPGWADPAAFPASRWVEGDYGTWRLVAVLYADAGGWTEIDEDEAARRRAGRTR